jgi:restriction system protein
MAVWLTRAGRNGEHEDLALNAGIVVNGTDLPDLSDLDSREAIERTLREVHPDDKPKAIKNWAGQIWAFRGRIKKGDLVVLPLKRRAAVAVGRVTGDYRYRPDHPDGARHTLPVEWVNPEIPRDAFGQDLLYSLGAYMAVCRIQRNRADERIEQLMETGTDPGAAAAETEEAGVDEEDKGIEVPSDLEEYATDQITAYTRDRFKRHELARLVTALLAAQGYHTYTSPPGPDGGVDIIAGRGTMGFDPPRLVVQVKSGERPADVAVLRELQGVMKNFGAEQALLVSWGGFKRSVFEEARRNFFEIRMWDAGDLIENLLENYDRLDEELQAELPLKRIWTLVTEEE